MRCYHAHEVCDHVHGNRILAWIFCRKSHDYRTSQWQTYGSVQTCNFCGYQHRNGTISGGAGQRVNHRRFSFELRYKTRKLGS